MEAEKLITAVLENDGLQNMKVVADREQPDKVIRLPVQQITPRKWRWVSRGLLVLHDWRARARQRHVLLTLDDRLLSDMGISRAEAERESIKWFWRP